MKNGQLAAYDDAYKDLLEEGPLKKGPLECPLEKGPLETQEIRPPDQVCHQDLEIRPITEPIKEPPHGRNDDLRGGDLQKKLEHSLEEDEIYDTLDDDDSLPKEEQPEGANKAKATQEPQNTPEPEAATKLRAIPESPERTPK